MGITGAYPRLSIKIRKNAHRLIQAFTGSLPANGRKKVLLLNYTGFEANHGCIATSASLVEMIKKKWPRATLQLEPINFDPPKTMVPVDPAGLNAFLPRLIASEKKRFRFFTWADVIIMNGEGSMHEYNGNGLNNCFLMRLIQLYMAKKIYGKTVMSVNQTIEFTKKYDGLVKKCLEGLDLVSVREPLSCERLLSIGLRNLRLSADAAFLTKRAGNGRAQALVRGKGISKEFITVFLSETIEGTSPEKTANLINGLRTTHKKDVLLVATTGVDIEHARRVSRLINVPILGLEASPEELVSVLRRSCLVLSGRYHCCIFAFLAGAPLIPLGSNSYKIEGLLKLMGYPIRIHDYAKDTDRTLIRAAEGALGKADELRCTIVRELPRVKALARASLDLPCASEISG